MLWILLVALCVPCATLYLWCLFVPRPPMRVGEWVIQVAEEWELGWDMDQGIG